MICSGPCDEVEEDEAEEEDAPVAEEEEGALVVPDAPADAPIMERDCVGPPGLLDLSVGKQ